MYGQSITFQEFITCALTTMVGWLILRGIVRFIYKQRAYIIRYYLTLPPRRWFGLFLVVVGIKFLTRESMDYLVYNNGNGMRLWFTVDSPMFDKDVPMTNTF